jgi:hypothetical protein
MSEMNLQMFFPPTKITEPKIEPVKKTSKYKYVMTTYVVEYRSIWKIPVEWDDTKIFVSYDELSYDNLNKEQIKKEVIKKEECEPQNEIDFYKEPDGNYPTQEGCQRGILICDFEKLNDETGYETCEDE